MTTGRINQVALLRKPTLPPVARLQKQTPAASDQANATQPLEGLRARSFLDEHTLLCTRQEEVLETHARSF